MKIIGTFILITIAVILFSSVTIIEANSSNKACESKKDCLESEMCFFGRCYTACDLLLLEGRKCTMINGKPSFECEPGYEFPKDGVHTEVCLPVSWECYFDKNDPGNYIKCKSGNWSCSNGLCGKTY